MDAYKTDPRFFEALVYTKVEQLRVPGNTVFIAERTDRVVDVFKGLVRYNFLSVPILQKTGRKYYGFLDMGDIVQYVVESFGAGKLEATQDFWQLIDKEEAFREKTVKDIMRYPVAFKNRYHPVAGGYSLLSALEVLARERTLHCLAVTDTDRNLLNIVTQSQLLRFVQENLDLLGPKANKPVGKIAGALKEVYKVNQSLPAIEAFKVMNGTDVSGLAVIDDDGRIVDNISLRDLKAMAPDAGLFWRLFGTTKTFLEKLQAERLGGRPYSVQVCSTDDTLGDIIKRLVDQKIHRIYITDSDQKPIGLLSLKDILLELLTQG